MRRNGRKARALRARRRAPERFDLPIILWAHKHKRRRYWNRTENSVEGDWKQVKGKVKEKWGVHADRSRDLRAINGRRGMG